MSDVYTKGWVCKCDWVGWRGYIQSFFERVVQWFIVVSEFIGFIECNDGVFNVEMF